MTLEASLEEQHAAALAEQRQHSEAKLQMQAREIEGLQVENGHLQVEIQRLQQVTMEQADESRWYQDELELQGQLHAAVVHAEGVLRGQLSQSSQQISKLEQQVSQLQQQVSQLQQQMGGANWLHALGQFGHTKAQLEMTQGELKQLKDLRVAGPRLIAKGDSLRQQVASDGAVRAAMRHDELQLAAPSKAADVGLTERRIDQLADALEQQIFAAGAGEVGRTRLIAAAVMQRPAMQRLLVKQSDSRAARRAKTMEAMLDHAKHVLRQLTTGKRGPRSTEDHVRFESIVAALIPEQATENQMMSTIGELLGIHWEQVDRAQRHNATNDGSRGAFSKATKVSRAIRKDFNLKGRIACRRFWHREPRFDTNARKKKRVKRLGPNKYLEHWRRVQYDTNRQMYEAFLASSEYNEYTAAGGVPISDRVFFEEKCKCVVMADNEECACPICTQMFELMRDWHRQRKDWHRDAAAAGRICQCGACEEGGAFRKASESLHALNDFLLCPHQTFPTLQITFGPHSTEEVKMRRRQCCKVPILKSHGGKASDACQECGYEKRMPKCSIECSAADPAEWKQYVPRGPTSSGGGNQEDLAVVRGTRAEFMDRLKKVYELWLPHNWIKRWCEHQRHLTYSTFGPDEACIMTDFSAVYDHKAFCSRCCEQPHHSHMDVFVVTWCRIEDGERKVYTEVVRVISEAKGGSHYHNTALRMIVDYLKTTIPGLKRVFTFTDGCKGQYKGRRNFGRIAQFPSQHAGVHLHHRFAASHHFKGPHDGYGKDFKLLSSTAERHKKRRMPTTFDWYSFGAEVMAAPMKRARTEIGRAHV